MVLGRLPFYGEPEVLPDRSQASSLSAEELVVAYHERTKHHFHRFAASVGYMDWATQPDPFRRYDGASLVRLPFPEMGQALPYWQLYVADSMEPAPLSIDSISLFFRYALSLTAWKRFHETTWSLRANPSSGNLHPTEAYTLLPAVGAIHDRPGVYHYAPQDHGLERRADVDPSVWTALMAAFPEDSFLVGLSSIHWREAWKYGERAFRYCQHDVGHALATLRFAAAALGWGVQLLPEWNATHLARLLGLDRVEDFEEAEQETPELLVQVNVNEAASAILSQAADTAIEWFGRANRLSHFHVEWPVIDQAIVSSERKAMRAKNPETGAFIAWSPPSPPACLHSAGKLIR